MTDREQVVQSGNTPWGLLWSLAAGFLACGMDLSLSYTLEQHVCSTGHQYVLVLISFFAMVVACSGFFTGFAEFRRFPANTREEGGSPFDRAHFQALLGMFWSLSFAVVILALSIPRWIVGPCE
jgi:hypothetical protein